MRVPQEVGISIRNVAFANAGMQTPLKGKLTEARSVGLSCVEHASAEKAEVSERGILLQSERNENTVQHQWRRSAIR